MVCHCREQSGIGSTAPASASAAVVRRFMRIVQGSRTMAENGDDPGGSGSQSGCAQHTRNSIRLFFHRKALLQSVPERFTIVECGQFGARFRQPSVHQPFKPTSVSTGRNDLGSQWNRGGQPQHQARYRSAQQSTRTLEGQYRSLGHAATALLTRLEPVFVLGNRHFQHRVLRRNDNRAKRGSVCVVGALVMDCHSEKTGGSKRFDIGSSLLERPTCGFLALVDAEKNLGRRVTGSLESTLPTVPKHREVTACQLARAAA